MSYESIAKELDVPKTDAEQFIVKAVQLGLVEGRMNQIQEEFAVTRTECIVVEGEWENMRQESPDVEEERPVRAGQLQSDYGVCVFDGTKRIMVVGNLNQTH